MMSLFGFADPYTMFDVTPVANLFIQEYMPGANGDFVKVYLYGLMQCYHPGEQTTLQSVARDLDLDERRVENAFGYWERKGLVRRISDNPPAYAYENLTQLQLMQAQGDDGVYRYADLLEGIQSILGADYYLRPSDSDMVIDWVEGLGLPQEVVLMLVSWRREKSKRKKDFLKSIAPIARKWAEAGVKTDTDAEEMMRTSTERYAAAQQVVKKLSGRHSVSEPEEELFAKWTERWGFDMQTILAAADETTKGSPTFGYLDGILERMHREGIRSAEQLREGQLFDTSVKELLRQLGMRGTGPTDDSRALVARFLAAGFERETISLAVVRVARKGGKLDALEKTLDIWKEAGLFTLEAAQAYLQRYDADHANDGRPGKGWEKQRPAKTVLAQQYTQREYTREELNALIKDI